MKLNAAQQQAVEAVSGPCLVLAGAGSGKTRVITAKIDYLISVQHLDPARICAVTFTNKAAAEMSERVADLVGKECAKQIRISTFHSLGLDILKREHRCLGLGRNFSLFNESDSRKIVGDILREELPTLLTAGSEYADIDSFTQKIAAFKSQLLKPDEIADAKLAEVYARYETYLHSCNALDFEDLIFKTTLLLSENQEVAKRWLPWFQYVLVDEYQDTNDTQYSLLKLLTSVCQRFTVVGDDDQSIYAWRGASPQNIEKLAEDYPDLVVIKLEENYRCTQHILNCANQLISHNSHLYNKTLYTKQAEGAKIGVWECSDEQDECRMVVADIMAKHQQRHNAYSDYAVLYRSNAQSRNFEREFHAARIPIKISGGTSFFELQEVKDMLAWSRVICNPHDNVALLRIINVPRRGIGTELLNLLSESSKLTGQSLYATALDKSVVASLTSTQKSSLGEFLRLVVQLRKMLVDYKDRELARDLIGLIGYERYLIASQPNKPELKNAKLNNARVFMSWIEDLIEGKKDGLELSFEEAVEKLYLREFLERQNKQGETDAVQLLTLHAAKGLEFPYVYLVGVEEDLLPHRNSQQSPQGEAEERRLCYVGITRAQQELNLSWCKKRGIGERQKDSRKSRFLNELPEADLELHRTDEPLSAEQQQSAQDSMAMLRDFLSEQLERTRHHAE
ncbi:MAG: UvrD-helicase domain-containing protein [Succinivibrio sp.]|nr:UvrD-helicase domain-containing protein [Succinivibrio sp.]